MTDDKIRKNAENQQDYPQKMDSITLLAGNMAHDFNNQLTVINGYADILLGMIPKTEEPYSMITEIRDAVMRSQELTEELLDFSRTKPLRTENVNINDMLGKLKNEINKTLNPRVVLEVINDSKPAEVRLDPNRLEKTIMNLVTNARDSMPEGGKLTICTSSADEISPNSIPESEESDTNCYVVLTVCDTGTGMDEATVDRIFEPFFTTKKNRKATGLGLSNVYGFVKQSGGKIEVQSKPSAGTTFRIYLPCVSKSAPA